MLESVIAHILVVVMPPPDEIYYFRWWIGKENQFPGYAGDLKSYLIICFSCRSISF